MSQSKFLIAINKKDYYYNGKQFLYKKKLGKNRFTKFKPIKTISFVKLILKNS